MARQEPAHEITLRRPTTVDGRSIRPPFGLVLLLFRALAGQGTAPGTAAAQPNPLELLFRSNQEIQAGNEHHYKIQEGGIIDKYRLLV